MRPYYISVIVWAKWPYAKHFKRWILLYVHYTSIQRKPPTRRKNTEGWVQMIRIKFFKTGEQSTACRWGWGGGGPISAAQGVAQVQRWCLPSLPGAQSTSVCDLLIHRAALQTGTTCTHSRSKDIGLGTSKKPGIWPCRNLNDSVPSSLLFWCFEITPGTRGVLEG